MIINLQDCIQKDYGTNKKVLFFYALRMLFSFLLCKFKLSDWSDIYATLPRRQRHLAAKPEIR